MDAAGPAGEWSGEVGTDGPQLVGVELLVLDLHLRTAVGTSAGTHDRRPVLLARVVTEEGEGWGECGALVEATAVDPSLEAVRRWTVDHVLPRLCTAAGVRGGVTPPAALLARSRTGGAEDRQALALLEMALLDAELRASGRSLADHLGATRTTVAVGTMVGIPPGRDLGALLDAVDRVLDPAFGGARRLRLKIAPGWDLAPVEAVRARHPDLALQVDANGAYRLGGDGEEAAEQLATLDPFGLTCIEQPLPAPDLAAHAQLATLVRTPLCLDESLRSPRHVRDALRYGAMAVACCKPARLGGLLAAVAAVGHCRDAGVSVFVGGLFETGLGRSANLALAGLDGFDVPGDLTAPTGYLDGSPFGYPEVVEGAVRLPTGPGIAPAPDPDLLERHVVGREWIARGST